MLVAASYFSLMVNSLFSCLWYFLLLLTGSPPAASCIKLPAYESLSATLQRCCWCGAIKGVYISPLSTINPFPSLVVVSSSQNVRESGYTRLHLWLAWHPQLVPLLGGRQCKSLKYAGDMLKLVKWLWKVWKTLSSNNFPFFQLNS